MIMTYQLIITYHYLSKHWWLYPFIIEMHFIEAIILLLHYLSVQSSIHYYYYFLSVSIADVEEARSSVAL